MQRERYDLITESSQDKEESLGIILNYVFSDEYIYINKVLRKLLKTNPRGYVHSDDLIKIPQVENYFKDIGVTDLNQKSCYIRGAVESRCHELHYNLGRVRRIVPFNMQKFKKMRPICIQRITDPTSIEDIRHIFSQNVFVLNQNIDKKEICDDILVYSENYRAKMMDIHSKNPPFSIMDFEQFYRQYDLSDRMRERKMKGIGRPIQMPKRRMQQFEKDNYRQNVDQDYESYRKQHRIYMKNHEKEDLVDFRTIGREPNSVFNQLLIDLLKNQAMNYQ